MVLHRAEVDREWIHIFYSCGRRQWVGGEGSPTPLTAVARNPMAQLWARGLEAAGRQQHRLSVSEASSEGDERNGGNVIRLGEDSVREWGGKGRGCGKPGVPLSAVSLFPHAEGRFGTLSWNNRELLYRRMSLLLLRMKQIPWLVSFHLSLMAGRGDSVLPAVTHPGHQEHQKQQAFVVILLVFVGELAQGKMKVSRNPYAAVDIPVKTEQICRIIL